jgi:hypothetical protein
MFYKLSQMTRDFSPLYVYMYLYVCVSWDEWTSEIEKSTLEPFGSLPSWFFPDRILIVMMARVIHGATLDDDSLNPIWALPRHYT